MSTKRIKNLFVNFLLLAILLSACSPAAVPQPTAVPTTPPHTATVPPLPTATVPPPTPTPTPTQEGQFTRHGYHDAAYDIESDRVIVFGGMTDTDHMLSDTWTYDISANVWTKMSPSQFPSHVEGPMAYDSASDRTILYAGTIINMPSEPLSYTIANQTWAYDCNTDTWTDLHAVGTPSGLLGARMVYDSKADRMILFGGMNIPITNFNNFIYHDDTWAYDFNTNTWTNLHPKTSPPGQNYFEMVYDAASDRVLAWITPDVGGSNTMWAYDYSTNTWTAQPVWLDWRVYAGMTYVPTLQLSFLFGGVTPQDETPYYEMWTYDSVTNTWEQVRFDSGPLARGWHTLTYSTKSDRIVLIGGGASRDTFTDEVWIFDPHTSTWTQVGPR